MKQTPTRDQAYTIQMLESLGSQMLDYLHQNDGKIFIPLDIQDQCLLIWDICRALARKGALEVEILDDGFEFNLPNQQWQAKPNKLSLA